MFKGGGEMNDYFGALSNAYRREIIKLLKWNNLSAGEIADHFGISQPAISRHLDVLRKSGMVTVESRGTQKIYSLNLTVINEFLMEVMDLFPNSVCPFPGGEEAYETNE